jgi:hypothetical protein
MYCVIKCVKTKHVLKLKFASSVFHNCNAKIQKTQICVTSPQCVNMLTPEYGNHKVQKTLDFMLLKLMKLTTQNQYFITIKM